MQGKNTPWVQAVQLLQEVTLGSVSSICATRHHRFMLFNFYKRDTKELCGSDCARRHLGFKQFNLCKKTPWVHVFNLRKKTPWVQVVQFVQDDTMCACTVIQNAKENEVFM